MSAGSTSNKPSFWMLPADNFVESLRDPVQRRQLSQKLRKELWMAYGLSLFAIAVEFALTFQNHSEMNDFWFILILLMCVSWLPDIRHRRHLIQLFEVLSKRESGT